MVSKLGAGAFGEVYCGNCEPVGHVAIKIIRAFDDETVNECKILR
jgi:hypothetical protein